jgi:CRISPR-associated protein Cmr5
LTREQAYAADVFKRVSDIKHNSPSKISRYGAMAHQLPLLIRTAGLVQALTFVSGRKDEGLNQLLHDLAQTVKQENAEKLIATSRNAPLAQYMRLTQQTMAALLWYKRFAQSVLEIDSTQAMEQKES